MLHAAASGTLQLPTGGGPAPVTQPWVYPLQADWTDDKQIIPLGTYDVDWDAVHWNCCGQSFIERSGILYFVLEAGRSWGQPSSSDPNVLEHANRARLGFWQTTDLFGTWGEAPNNPRIVFDPVDGANDLEEGTWHHSIAVDAAGEYTCIFGGQRTSGSSTTSVDIAIYYAESPDLQDWGAGATNPFTITSTSTNRIISDVSTFAGCDNAIGEIAPGGLHWDAALSRWDIVYIGKNLVEPQHWALYHAWGPAVTSLTPANSELLLNTHQNPMSALLPTGSTDAADGANGQWYPGIIVDRGFGYKDVLATGFSHQEGVSFTDCALIRIPIAEPGTPYSWADPGPTEILYKARDSFMGIPAGMQMMATLGAYLTQQRVALAYQHYRYGALTGQQQRQRMMHAPLVRTADGRPGYTPVATRFTASNSQFLSRASQMTGQQSSPNVTFCVNVKMISLPLAGGEMVFWRFEEAGSYRFVVVVNDAGVVTLLGRTDAGGTILTIACTVPLQVGVWTSIVASLNMASYANSWIRIGGVDAKPPTISSPNVFTSGSIGFNDSASMVFGAQLGTPNSKFLDAEVADCGLCIGWHVPSAALNRFLYASPATLQNPRTDGRGLFPTIPHAFFSGSGTAFQTNRGKGGAWVMNGGSLTAAASAPAGHPGTGGGGPVAPVAVNDTNPALTVGTGIQDIPVLSNDIYSGTPSISIQSQTDAGMATTFGSGASSVIRIQTNGFSPGPKTITYVLTADGNVGSDTATLTFQLQAAGAYAPQGVVFDGASYSLRTTALAGVSDSAMGTIVASVMLKGTDSDQHIFSINNSAGSAKFHFGRINGGLYVGGRNSANTTNRLRVETTALAPDVWHSVLISWNLANTAQRHFYINDAPATLVTSDWITYDTTATINYSGSRIAVGAQPATTPDRFFIGELADISFYPGVYVDFSVVANRRKFFEATTHCVVDKGADGSVPFGSSPAGFFSGDASTFHQNKGSGGTSFTLTGTLTNSAADPCGAGGGGPGPGPFGQDGAAQYHGLIAPTGGGTTFDVSHIFGASANVLTVMFGWEEADNISSVVLDPAGVNITMTQINNAAQGDNKCAAYYADTLSFGAGAKTIRLTFSGAITSSGIVVESQSYIGAANDPPTPVDTDGSTTGNVDGLSLTGANTDGIMKVVAATNGSAGVTVTATGATLINQHIEAAYTVSFSQKIGSLAATETPGFTLSSGTLRNCAVAFVVNPASGGPGLLAYSGEEVEYSGEDVIYP